MIRGGMHDVVFGGHAYKVIVSTPGLAKDGDAQRIEIERDGVWAGRGKLAAGRIDGCAADIDNAAYRAIEAALASKVKK